MARALLSETLIERTGFRGVRLAPGATVHVYESGTTTPIASAMHDALTGGAVLSNPLTADANGSVIAYLDADQAGDLLVVEGSMSRTVPFVALSGVGGGGSLPSWWTVDSTPGSESAIFGGAIDINPGRDVSALILRGFAGNTENILRVYDDAGALAADLDSSGRLDVRSFNVQVPPDVGPAPGGSVSNIQPTRWAISSGNDTTDAPLQIKKWDGVSGYAHRFDITYQNQIVLTTPMGNEVSWTISAPETPAASNAIEMWDYPFDNLLWALSYTGYQKIAVHAAPADGDIATGQCALWFDDTNGAAKLMVKAKQADGTVKTAAVALA